MTPRRDRQIVDHVHHAFVRALGKQLEPSGATGLTGRAFIRRRDIAHDLSRADRTAGGGRQIELTIAPEDAFPARHERRTLGMTAIVQIARRALDVIQVDPGHVAPVPDRPFAVALVTAVCARLVDKGHGLKPAAVDQFAGRGRDETVKETFVVVLRQIDDAGPGIDAHRLVVEPAHRLQGHRGDQTGRVRRHFEDPAVGLGHIGVGGCLERLFAGQPAAPRGVAARAVGAGPGQRQVLAHRLAGLEVVNQGRRAARQGPSILVGVIALGRVQQADPLLTETAGAEVTVQAAGPLEFVVANQGHTRSVKREASHPVRLTRHEQPVVHGVAALGDDLVGKALRQIEQAVGVRDQRAIAVDLIDIGFFRGGRLGRNTVGQAGKGKGGGRAGDQVTTMGAHGRLQYGYGAYDRRGGRGHHGSVTPLLRLAVFQSLNARPATTAFAPNFARRTSIAVSVLRARVSAVSNRAWESGASMISPMPMPIRR